MEQEQFIVLSKYFIRLIRYGMGLTETFPEKPEDVAWSDVYSLAKHHSLTAVIFEAVKRSGAELEGELRKRWEGAYNACLHVDLQQQIAWEELKEIAAEKDLNMLPLKGIGLKSLYPRSELRQMGDLDVLYPQKRFEDLKKGLTEAGYDYDKKSAGMHHQIFSRPPDVHLEMHGSLMNDDVEFADYYANPWSKAKPTDEKNVWRFSHEDEYIFMLLHAAKHYFSCGSGVRTFLDLYVFLRRYQAEMNFRYIEEELAKATALAKKKGAKYDLVEFEKTACALAENWFGKDEPTTDESGLYVISAGVYGIIENLWKKDYEKEGKGYLLRRLFPSLKKMQERNPVLKKAPFLLPFFWLGRLFKGLTSDRAHREYRYIKKQKKATKDLTKSL